ncbi:M20 metallopeptidase family protein [Microbacterium ulmi]|uniref:Amidohydrolase n=1 Tax=Microbacterium ulmi TaxID=179095 RepID=A0A7Y2M3N6_9MICO|nr:M20 family metallopeptidase [Microbacterium ulmi]NII70236.1 hippurate hydrolase [Microbacterium ulmi]NNH04503.1 amidohydrolase [Microbacterium ulmi]
MDLLAEGAALLPALQSLRRELHRDPEVGLQLPRTQQRVLDAIAGLDLDITVGTATSSVVAVLRGGLPGPVVLLRGDMDGLPVAEQTGLDFASDNGAMHACGHDLHTAGLVGAAHLLAAHRDELPGTVVFMFQPGEEGYNGASIMLGEGLLDVAGARPVAAFAAHVAPGPYGVFATRGGPLMAGSSELSVTVRGAGGHGSMPFTAADPVPALAEIVTGLQTMTTRAFDVFDPVVVSVTMLEAGTAVNVIPDRASLRATVRTLSQASVDKLIERTRALAEGVASAHGCTADVDFDVLYPVTVNDRFETERSVDTLRSLLGEERVQLAERPAMGSEDFAFVLQEVAGTFLMVQCSPPGLDSSAVAFNHSPFVLFDDAILGDLAAALAHLAWSRLHA